jgi:hypothetical protein
MARRSSVLPVPEGPLDGEALAGGHLEGEGRQRARLQMPDAQHGFGALLVVGRHEP